MKLKILVGFFLFLALFIIGSIFLISFLKTPLFVYLYFIFSLLFLIGVGASLKKNFPEGISFSFLLIAILFVAISLTFFGSSVKNYYDKNKEISAELNPSSQIPALEKANAYYTDYVTFLNGEILKIKQDSLILQAQIESLKTQKNTTTKTDDEESDNPPSTTQDNSPIIIVSEEDEKEEEEEYDD